MVRYIAENDDDALTLHEPPPRAYLSLLVSGRISQIFPLRGEINIGRDKGNSVVISDQKVSRHHASLTPIDNAFIISDKGSANGTYLNGVLITQPIRLKDKDHITVGDTHFLFSVSEPDPNAIEPIAFSKPKNSSPPVIPSAPSIAMPATFNDKSMWVLVGCLGLIIVSLLLILAVMIGLFFGRGQAATPSDTFWLAQLALITMLAL